MPRPEWWWSQGGIQDEVPEAGTRVAQCEGCVGGGGSTMLSLEGRQCWNMENLVGRCGVKGFILIGMDVWRVLSRDVT